ncbi:MAG TPA: NADH-quinone oxidoreductase subunit L [Dehalococcoidales bacterium]|nr:NADH-quinone oxidoreductase subunit L [Dehalococcoidales bacterium]
MPNIAIWFILLLPVIAFVVISLVVRPLVRPARSISGYIAIAAIGGALVLSLWALVEVMNQPEHILTVTPLPWLSIGDFTFSVNVLMDSLTAVMLVVVTSVSLLVQIYSQGYMRGDAGYHRYFAWMSLFTASMIGLVLADNLLMMFVFWEMVGLCSYLLIGFWFQRPAAANAAKKAFIVTRLGDFGFLAALLILYANTGTFEIAQLRELAVTGALAGSVLTWAAIGIFAGAAGKSAQFPLHTWLADAMEGPTPVSALIHAATMVAAGVFLVARMLPLFEHSTAALNTVAVIGAFTAIFAASMGLVANDIKRVLAYSTVSQLGFMMLGLAAGGVAVGIFHLFNHAFFKALLFLGAGSVNHATGTFDIRQMGGLRKVMPWTCALFVLGSLSLAGIWPLAGFWSKDEILVKALDFNTLLFALAMVTVFMTAFYMFRVVFLTFGGKSRSQGHHGTHAHESPWVMVLPMLVLGILAVISGYWNVTGQFSTFLGEGHGLKSFISGFFGVLTHPMALISILVAAAGIVLAWAIYSARLISAEKIGNLFKPVYTVLINKYWMDELYENLFVKNFLNKGLFRVFQWFDTHVVDGATRGTASGAINSGRGARQTQTGQLQLYAITIAAGIVVIAVTWLILGR